MLKRYIAYISDNPHKYWFKAKTYGWGWTPATWQGWLVLTVYLAAIILLSLTISVSSPPSEVAFTFILPAAILTSMLIRICYKKGEKPRWRWGAEENDSH